MAQTNIVRIGKVSSTDPTTATVKVVFSDLDNMVSDDLPVVYPQANKNKAYAMPDVGENVLCIFIEQGVGDGFCIGCFYTDTETPPTTDQEKVNYTFEDGTVLEYDRKEHKLKADIKGNAEITAENVSLKCTNGSINGENLEISGGNITLSGDITLSGSITLSGPVSCPGYCKC